ncbi:hypothetical protein GCM10011344_13840 [Dokdonia pacifica]|uniref:Leucine rich repeat-containing protein n=1 Tax=Dokdonia pacifica TaxID=1627892 RepID=A0A238W747_9FLAO|nr:leucine-rich repeat domain-containing protein [Dokdonia pacifica]GGG14467.1 hypothetical protein GCM10011344_13840 [Dokdonia pacifica]SNR42386.1 Leucine rich repeat-containing protein [Dokdonia pacifica]
MKTIVSLLITLLLSVVSYAQTFTVSGLNYEVISSNQVKVTGGNFAFTNLTIPAFVTNNGTEFIVREIGDSAFENGQLESVVLPNSIFVIDRDAFRNNQLSSVTIPNFVVTVGIDAFRDNQLTDVTLGNRVEVLDLGAFRNNQIVDITIPASMINIENGAFRDNTGLRTIEALGTTPAMVSTSGVDNDSFRDRSVINLTVPAGAEEAYAAANWVNFFSVNGQYTGEIGDTIVANNSITYRFLSGNPNQASIINNTNSGDISFGPILSVRGIIFDVIIIEQDAFRGNNITSVTLPNSIINIGRGAFFQNQITSVTIPNSVIIVGQDAFRDNQLTEVTLGNSVTTLRAGAFRNNDIEEITLPASMATIENGVFRDNTTLRRIDALGTNPATIVTSNGLDTDSFRDRTLISLVVPEGTEATYAAADWVNFFSVNGVYSRPEGQTFTANGITYNITFTGSLPNLVDIVESDDDIVTGDLVIEGVITENRTDFEVIDIENNAFRNRALTSVSIPNTVINIGQDAFRDNQITSMTLGNSVESLGPGAFRNNQITAITIPASMRDIANGVFRDNTTIRQINALGTNPATVVTSSGQDTDSFRDRSRISLVVPEGSEATYAVDNWVNFFSVNRVYTLPLDTEFTSNNITYKVVAAGSPNTAHIVDNTNSGDLVIQGFITSNRTDFDVVEIEPNAFRNNNITSVTIPNSITDIGQDAFRDNQITSMILGNSVETLGPGAFRNNQIVEITLPASMTNIANGVFRDNVSFVRVIALGTTPASIVNSGVDNDSFRDRSRVNLTVPEGFETIYENAGWIGFFGVNGVYTGPLGGIFNATSGTNYRLIASNPNQATIIGNENSGNITINGRPSLNGIRFDIIEIEDDAFRNDNITSVTIPDSVIDIGANAFRDNQLTDVTLGNSIETIGIGVFRGNDLTSVSIPNSVIEIAQDAFRDNVALTDVSLGNSVTTLGPGAFRNADVAEITLPASMTSLANGVFRDNTNLTKVIALGATPAAIVTSGIDNDSFRDRSVIDLIVPEGTIQTYLDADWTGFGSINDEAVGITLTIEGLRYTIISESPNEVAVIGGTTIPSDLILPETVTIGERGDYTLVSIGESAFLTSGLTSVTLPSTIRHIEDLSFGNNALTEINLPEGLETIGIASFRMNDLTSITIPSTVQSIGQGAFEINALDTVIALGEIPATIQPLTFGNRAGIDLSVPPGTTQAYLDAGWTDFASINDNTFLDDGLVYRIISELPNEVEVIGGTGISTNLIVPETVLIQEQIFTVTAIGRAAFEERSLTSVALPNTLESIGIRAFFGNAITMPILPDNLNSIGFRAFQENNISGTFILPNSVSSLANASFEDNEITELIISTNITNLGNNTFRNNQITNLVIPSNVTRLGDNIFLDNPMASVTVEAITPPSIVTGTQDSFGNRRILIDLFVPEGTTQAYLDEGWTGFRSITEFAIDITVAPKVFLQGAATNPIAGEEDLMRDSLRENGLLPTTSPYGDGATVDPTVFTTIGANAIVDWVLVELRSGADNDNTTVVNSTAALLQRDGDIVGLDGTSNITFTEDAGDYFIAIRHRNHIGILAAVPAPLSSTASTLDFTQDPAFAKGENLALSEVNGTFAMIAGDADGSSQILNTDITEALSLAGGSEAYSTADADMNGFVLNSDIQLLVLANSGTVQQFD